MFTSSAFRLSVVVFVLVLAAGCKKESVPAAKEAAESAKQAATRAVESAKETAAPLVESGKAAASEAAQTARPYLEKGKAVATQAVAEVKPYVARGAAVATRAADKAVSYVAQGKAATTQALETAERYVEKAEAAATQAVEKAKEAVRAASLGGRRLRLCAGRAIGSPAFRRALATLPCGDRQVVAVGEPAEADGRYGYTHESDEQEQAGEVHCGASGTVAGLCHGGGGSDIDVERDEHGGAEGGDPAHGNDLPDGRSVVAFRHGQTPAFRFAPGAAVGLL